MEGQMVDRNPCVREIEPPEADYERFHAYCLKLGYFQRVLGRPAFRNDEGNELELLGAHRVGLEYQVKIVERARGAAHGLGRVLFYRFNSATPSRMTLHSEQRHAPRRRLAPVF